MLFRQFMPQKSFLFARRAMALSLSLAIILNSGLVASADAANNQPGQRYFKRTQVLFLEQGVNAPIITQIQSFDPSAKALEFRMAFSRLKAFAHIFYLSPLKREWDVSHR